MSGINLEIEMVNEVKYLDDGEYNGTIKSIFIKEIGSGKYLNCSIECKSNQSIANLYFKMKVSFIEDSMLIKVLKDFGIIRDIGEKINLKYLIDKPVIAKVKNNYVGEKQYSNIVDIKFDEEKYEEIKAQEEEFINNAESILCD